MKLQRNIIICFFFLFGIYGETFYAQTQAEGAKVVTVSQAKSAYGEYYVQVGLPILSVTAPPYEVHTTTPADIRYPWHIQYLYETFSEESFTVSKGYYSDKIIINWNVRNNASLINYFNLYRRKVSIVEEPFQLITTISSIQSQYEDKYIEGNVLYDYRLEAVGVSSTSELYKTYIEGVGFRNPVGIITGNISFEGGNPVKDVTVIATSPSNTGTSRQSAIKIPKESWIEVNNINNKDIADAVTFQAWVHPDQNFTDTDSQMPIFALKNSSNTMSKVVRVKLWSATDKYLEVDIDGSIYKIYNYYPSGELNAMGNDILTPVTEFNNEYIHFTVVIESGEIPLLYINGRKIDALYASTVHDLLNDVDPEYTSPYIIVEEPTNSIDLNIIQPNGIAVNWTNIAFGSQRDMRIDEVRVWNKKLEEDRIYYDYKRFIDGNDSNLVTYLRMDEGVGTIAYDLSHEGFKYNNNNGQLSDDEYDPMDNPFWVFGAEIPRADQLGVLGVTDAQGNYVISAIPYSGAGQSYVITPIFGVHQFEQKQELVYLGEGNTVINAVDFIDVSSFKFTGKVLYDSRGVFNSFVEVNSSDPTSPNFVGLTDGDEYVSNPGIVDEGYNYYEKNGEKFNKGEYWLNDAGTLNDSSDDYLERYARIPSVGASIYIDNQVVLDENNIPVVSDSEGNFEISVPIGNHYISVRQNGHEYGFSGRFPAESGSLHEFFEDSNEQVVFIDETKVTLVGRVVGGSVESVKPIGFGHEGLNEKTITNSDGVPETFVLSSINNIGTASITLDYTPPTGSVTAYTRSNFNTNLETGEFRKDVLPLDYTINQTSGLSIVNNSALNILSANETLSLSNIVETTTPTFDFPDGTSETGVPYHYEKSFTYRSTPVLNVTNQRSDSEIEIDADTKLSTQGVAYPIYTQFKTYQIELRRFERYTNYDTDTNGVETTVPVTDGELLITNNLALADSEEVEVNNVDQSQLTYSFRAGLPSISSPFTRTININYRVNGVDYAAENYLTEGIILGGQSDGSQTFITAAPDTPDIILRDPPGSNSFATIESGESITFTTEHDFSSNQGISTNLKLLLGVKFAAGGGLAGPIIETEATNNVELGIGFSASSTTGESLTKTYTFNQSISTSDDPDYTGANGDLYIGQSKNYAYGSYDNVQVSENEIDNDGSNLQLTNSDGENFFVSAQKAIFFSEEPSETFFIFSQRYLLETLIPELELIVSNIENGLLDESDPGVLTKDEYVEQITLWRKVILENERTKYIIKNDREAYKAQVLATVDGHISEVQDALASSSDPAGAARLRDRLVASNNLKEILNTNFEDNISFDAGAGTVSRSVETSIINTSSLSYNVNIEENFAFQLGFQVNKFGLINNTSGFFNQDINTSITEEEASTVSLSYSFIDNDQANLLSVDIVNAFDGNGPVFSTIGGRTSCPYEGAEMSLFFNNGTYDPEATTIIELAEADQEELSAATQQVEVPLISVEVADISNVLEDEAAEFKLILENNGIEKEDNYYTLLIDNTTNPHNAITNIATNGSTVVVPYGEEVEFTLTLRKSVSDVYDYEDIVVRLQSVCDEDDVSDEVSISAHFIPSCTNVNVTAPLENWVYNVDTAYNVDGTTNPLDIELTGFNTSFDNFQKIDLEYRLATSPTWTRLHTYYNTQEFYDDALANNEIQISLINDTTINYSWDIVGDNIQNGNYEIRAVSTCTNDTNFISDVILGKIDLTSPVLFGTPEPIDGILSYGEDLKVRFNEPIFYNSSVSLIEIKGETNQLPINNEVSLYFNGSSNIATIENPYIKTGDFTLEFWMNNGTSSGTATIVNQENGVQIGLNNNSISFKFGEDMVQGLISNDNLFHHYTFVYQEDSGTLSIYEDNTIVVSDPATPNLEYNFDDSLIIGGNTFIGNIHDLRLWSKAINFADAYANIYTKYIGNEKDLTGYWPMNEGNGDLAKDLARFKHAQVNTSWDIKPKGNSYEFTNNQYLIFDNVGYVQLTDEMDATLSFWIKTGVSQSSTIFSNGRGDETDIALPDGSANKWAINLNNDGNLSFENENVSLPLTTNSITDNNWHHISILLNRLGNLKTYVDAELVSTNPSADISGFYGNKIWVGARGHIDLASIETVDREFTGKINEVRLWNTLRNFEQIERDRYNEVDFDSPGLLFYSKMNAPDSFTGNGPRYYHITSGAQTTNSLALISNGTVNYSDDTPPIKPARNLVKFQVNHVINGDEMIINPIVSSLAVIEGQVLDITVHRMFDQVNNIQQSPITWTAYYNKNQLDWSIDGNEDMVDAEILQGEEKTFQIVVRNSGGNSKGFEISNIPNWLTLSKTSGTINPNSIFEISASVDPQLAYGNYQQDLFLVTDFGYDQKIQLNISVTNSGPDWVVNPALYDYSLNIIGKIKIDGVFSSNVKDKIGAFVNGELRGVGNLVYDEDYQDYFIYLTVYSNDVSGEEINFNLWNSSNDIIYAVNINDNPSLQFISNSVLGSKSNPQIFESLNQLFQETRLNAGWTWVSLFVNDSNFSNINELTNGLDLETSDRILSHAPALLETYQKNSENSGWSGTISQNGGLSANKMYKINVLNNQSLNMRGPLINLDSWSFPIKVNWNWFPFVIPNNAKLNDAMANYNPSEGDVIKSQNKFAIYDALSGWSGSLEYLEKGQGYMLKSSIDQNFSYPSYLSNLSSRKAVSKSENQNGTTELQMTNFASYSDNMNLVAQLPEGYSKVFVYNNESELKGLAETQIVNGKELSFVTVYGDNYSSEDLVFYVGNNPISKNVTSTRIFFQPNAVMGTIQEPFIITLPDDNQYNVYPNPFESKLHLDLYADKRQNTEIRIFNYLGQLVLSKAYQLDKGANNIELDLSLPSGVYILNMGIDNRDIVQKIIKN